MADLQKVFYVDDEVPSKIISIFKEAKKYAVIVTPYLELWPHVAAAIDVALSKHVEVTFVIRREPGIMAKRSVNVLLQNNIKVLGIASLHAKIYVNESSVIISSMNLHKSSAQNSLEIALVVQDPETKQQIRDYVNDTLMPLASPLSSESNEPNYQPHSGPQTQPSEQVTGNCIRCGRPVTLDPGRPLCEECYDVWAQWEDEDYPEKVCHFCGRPSNVSYGKPLCGVCYRSLR